MQSLLRSSVPPKVDVSALGEPALATRFEANLTSGSASLANLRATVFGASISGNLDAIPGKNGNVFRGSVSYVAVCAGRVREGVRLDAAAED